MQSFLIKNRKRIEAAIWLTFIILVILMLRILYLANQLPDNKQDVIREHLSREGYAVENINFEESGIDGVYKASSPVIIENGDEIVFWKIEKHSFYISPRSFGIQYYSVSPYYDVSDTNML